MYLTIAEHIAEFTPKTKFREKQYLKYLRRSRKTAYREPDINKPTPPEIGSNRVSKP
jgi:hypothetical protein